MFAHETMFAAPAEMAAARTCLAGMAGFTYSTAMPAAFALYSTKVCNCRHAQQWGLARTRFAALIRSRMRQAFYRDCGDRPCGGLDDGLARFVAHGTGFPRRISRPEPLVRALGGRGTGDGSAAKVTVTRTVPTFAAEDLAQAMGGEGARVSWITIPHENRA